MAFDTFIKFEPAVEGESTRSGFEKQIEVFSFSWGASNPTTVSSGTGLSAGKVSISSFNIMKKTEKSSPLLFQGCCNGKHYDKVTVTMNKAAGVDKPLNFLVYEFGDVMVESIQWSGSSGGDDTPTESVSLAFATCKITYTPQSEKGSAAPQPVGAGWDLKQVKSVGAK